MLNAHLLWCGAWYLICQSLSDRRAAVQEKCTVWTLVKLFMYDVQGKKHGNKNIVQKMFEVSRGRWHVNIIIITGFEVQSALLMKIHFLWDGNAVVIGK